MTGPERRTFPFRMGAALVAALMLSALPAAASDNNASAASDEPPTVAECEQQWASSAADDTCRNETVTVEDGMCRIEAECLAPLTATSEGENSPVGDVYYSNEFVGSLYEVVRLSNCGGTLTVGSC